MSFHTYHLFIKNKETSERELYYIGKTMQNVFLRFGQHVDKQKFPPEFDIEFPPTRHEYSTAEELRFNEIRDIVTFQPPANSNYKDWYFSGNGYSSRKFIKMLFAEYSKGLGLTYIHNFQNSWVDRGDKIPATNEFWEALSYEITELKLQYLEQDKFINYLFSSLHSSGFNFVEYIPAIVDSKSMFHISNIKSVITKKTLNEVYLYERSIHKLVSRTYQFVTGCLTDDNFEELFSFLKSSEPNKSERELINELLVAFLSTKNLKFSECPKIYQLIKKNPLVMRKYIENNCFV